MDNTKILEAFIATLRLKLSESIFRAAELETLLLLEQEKTNKLQSELEESKSSTSPGTTKPE